MISYAQAKEDIYLWRALAPRVHHSVGFWIDIGGYDPVIDSVTKTFYDCGWRGINVEPLAENHARFVRDRERDTNIQAAATDRSGDVEFHEIVGHQLGTMVEKFADRHAATGFERRKIVVPGMTLTEICEQHAPAEIHFLKIDVEGHEGKVLAGMDFTRFRPWMLVIEATEPNTSAPTFHEWDHAVIAAGYTFAYTDVLNRYYVANEHADLASVFAIPADDYILASTLREIEALRKDLEETRARVAALEGAKGYETA